MRSSSYPSAPRPNLREKISFRLDADRMHYLERYAAHEGVPVSLIVRHLVCRFVEENRRSFAPLSMGGK